MRSHKNGYICEFTLWVLFFLSFNDSPWRLEQVTFLRVHKYVGVLDGDLTDYVLTAKSSRADKSYACMHINTHIHSMVNSEAKIIPFMEGKGAKEYHKKCSFLDKLFTQLHETWATVSICMHLLIFNRRQNREITNGDKRRNCNTSFSHLNKNMS